MADDTDSTGLGLIVGILAVVAVMLVAGIFGPRFFRSSPPADVDVRIEAPAQPAPNAG
jgi:hypothetical protein